MGLTCSCEYDHEWFYHAGAETLLSTKNRRRCYSCTARIGIGETTLPLFCYRPPLSEIEYRIHGDEVPLATRYFCEMCGDLYSSLSELGFCISLPSNMRDLVKEYAMTYGPATSPRPVGRGETK